MLTFCDALHETKQEMYTNCREFAVWSGNHFKLLLTISHQILTNIMSACGIGSLANTD